MEATVSMCCRHLEVAAAAGCRGEGGVNLSPLALCCQPLPFSASFFLFTYRHYTTVIFLLDVLLPPVSIKYMA